MFPKALTTPTRQRHLLSPRTQAALNKHLPNISANSRLPALPETTPTTPVATSEAACLTDLCCDENLPEVEIISLIEETIPKYKLRMDATTNFMGYTSNRDWDSQIPVMNNASLAGVGISKELARETLNYFLLCGNRISQMTRTYDDIEAVTRLLEEKEKDLELTAQIGQDLLTENVKLEKRIKELEEELRSSNDDRAQLLHDIHKKSELIDVLTNACDESNENITPTLSKSITVDLLEKKILELKDQNSSLMSEATELAIKTDEVEEHERQLMLDISTQLTEANSQYDNLCLELERQREENRLQHEQIVSLQERLSEAQMRLHQLTQENEENLTMISHTKDTQVSLAEDLMKLHQRYEEKCILLHEAQEQLKQHHKKAQPHVRSGCFGTFNYSSYSSYGLPPADSLQAELMGASMMSENSLDSGISDETQRDRISRLMTQIPGSGNVSAGFACLPSVAGRPVAPYKRTFDTVRCAEKSGSFADNEGSTNLGSMSMSSSSRTRVSSLIHPAGSYYRGSSNSLGGRSLSTESLSSQPDEGYPGQKVGVPGAPGAKELEEALKRLTPADLSARRAILSYNAGAAYSSDDETQISLPLGIRTPDSVISSSSGCRPVMLPSQQWRLPEKLQIVKPMEGSQTLHHWNRLATPTLGGLLDEHPGVKVRGGRELEDLGMQMYCLSDVEEDAVDYSPGKQFDALASTYTYTNSMVMHPDDGLANDLSFLTRSQMSSRMASNSTSRQPSCPPTPRPGLSRKNSCTTFSTNLSLASMLNERGIKAITPSAINTPAGANFSPTVTPSNSPESHSPHRCPSPEPVNNLLSSGADRIRNMLMGSEMERPVRNQEKNKKQKIMLARLERRALRSLNLVNAVEKIGLENIFPNRSNASLGDATSRSSSPFSQRGAISTSSSSNQPVVFDNEQLRDVLKQFETTKLQEDGASTRAKSNDSDDSDCGIIMKANPVQSSTHSESIKPKAAADAIAAPAQSSQSQVKPTTTTTGGSTAITNTRVGQMQRQKSRRNLKNGMAQRPDLGTTVAGGSSSTRMRPDLGRVGGAAAASPAPESDEAQHPESPEARTAQTLTQSFVGSVSSLLFGRKGGWL